MDGSDDPLVLKRRLERERRARQEAEAIAERATRELYSDVQRTLRDLQASQRRLSSILAAVADGIVGVDRHGQVEFLNPAAARILRTTPEGCLGRAEHDVLHGGAEGRGDLGSCPVHQTLRHGTGRLVEDDQIWRADGSWFRADYTCAPLVDDGTVVGAVVAFREATDRDVLARLIRKDGT